MEPEGIVHVLRQLCEGLLPGGVLVDLQAIQPSGRVEVDDALVGRIDDSAFYARAERAVLGLDALRDAGLIECGPQITFGTLVGYDSGPELVAAVEAADERRMPPELAAALADAGACVVRERSLVRVLVRR